MVRLYTKLFVHNFGSNGTKPINQIRNILGELQSNLYCELRCFPDRLFEYLPMSISVFFAY